jgi:putative heme-binding domain-containing protein
VQAAQDVPTTIARLLRTTLVVALLWQAATTMAAERHARGAHAATAANIAEGRSVFHANCAPCHGLGARGGGRGPDLTSGNWAHGGSDAEIFLTITQGVPGTDMPANALEDAEVRSIIAFLRSLAPPAHPPIAGDPVRGQQIFAVTAGCANCHMVNGTGGRLGPDLSRVGAARAVTYLIDSIREPDKELTSGPLDPNNHYGLPLPYDSVTVVTAGGERTVGVARNEDTFSIQLLTMDQDLRFFLKKDVRELIHERKSLMPAYPESVLSMPQLQDLLAYLVTLGQDRRAAVKGRR